MESVSKNSSILIVEDEERARIDTQSLLSKHYERVLSAGSAKEALELYYAHKPDIFIVDIFLPDMNGIDLIKAIRRHFPKACVVVISGTGSVDLLAEAIELNIDRFIKKPFDPSAFLEVIRSLEVRILLERENIHQQKILGEYKKAIDVSNIVSITDKRGVIKYANDMFCRISGYSREELVGQKHNIIRHPEMEDAVFKEMWQQITSKQVWKGVVKNRAKDGSTYIVDSVIVPIVDEYGRIEEYIAIRHDLTELMQKNAIIKRQSTDSLTGLENRIKLIEDIESSSSVVLCLINIDGFSDVNDVYGIEFGDRILALAAKRIVQSLPDRDYRPYRLGGDEFAILLSSAREDYMEVFKKAVESITLEPLLNEGQIVYLTARMGIAINEGRDSLSKASLAIKHAKEMRQGIIIYERHFNLESGYKSNILWANRLFRALGERRIKPFFQPILNLKTGKIEKYEALVRMMDEEKGEVSPFYFLEIAKKTKQYHHITKIMVSEGIQKALESGKEISINLSVEDLENPFTLEYIFGELERYGCGERIIFEITESEGVNNYEQVRNFIKHSKERFGCKIAIDDFGSGYSNFSNILELEIDFLKIDGSIVKNILEDPRSRALLDGITSLSHKLGIECVAEFVSTKEIMESLRESGVDFAQGYYVGKPSPELIPSKA